MVTGASRAARHARTIWGRCCLTVRPQLAQPAPGRGVPGHERLRAGGAISSRAGGPGACERLIGPIYRDMRHQFTGEFEDIISTIEFYCTGEGWPPPPGSCTSTKTPLIYRIKKVSSIAGVEKESAFVKEFSCASWCSTTASTPASP